MFTPRRAPLSFDRAGPMKRLFLLSWPAVCSPHREHTEASPEAEESFGTTGDHTARPEADRFVERSIYKQGRRFVGDEDGREREVSGVGQASLDAVAGFRGQAEGMRQVLALEAIRVPAEGVSDEAHLVGESPAENTHQEMHTQCEALGTRQVTVQRLRHEARHFLARGELAREKGDNGAWCPHNQVRAGMPM